MPSRYWRERQSQALAGPSLPTPHSNQAPNNKGQQGGRGGKAGGRGKGGAAVEPAVGPSVGVLELPDDLDDVFSSFEVPGESFLNLKFEPVV